MAKRILVVDDDDFCRAYFSGFLRESGFEVAEAKDGREGIRQFQRKPADVVILDLFMPRMNGLETLLRIDPKHSGIPVIVISGGNFPEIREPSLLTDALGAARFLPKPFLREELLAVVEELIRAGRPSPPEPVPPA